MTRKIFKGKRFRFNVDFTEEERIELEKLTILSEASSASDAVRRSLRVYRAIVDCHTSGGRIVLKDENGFERELSLGF